MRPIRHRSAPVFVAVLLLLSACAQWRTTESAGGGEVYYASTAGLTVHAEPSASSEVVGHLALHEKVTRSRVEQGYAHVVATPSGVEGWVDNAQLIWRLPPDPAVSDRTPAAEPETTPAETTPAKTMPAVATPVVETPPDPPPAPAPVSAPPDPPAEKPATPTPAVYDPF